MQAVAERSAITSPGDRGRVLAVGRRRTRWPAPMTKVNYMRRITTRMRRIPSSYERGSERNEPGRTETATALWKHHREASRVMALASSLRSVPTVFQRAFFDVPVSGRSDATEQIRLIRVVIRLM